MSHKNYRLFEESPRRTSYTNRQRIYLYIKNNPGVHLRKISKSLNLAIGDTNYHLNSLEQSGFIKHGKWGIYKRYFVVAIQDKRSESILAILQQDTPRAIVLFLLEHPGSIQSEICRHISFSAPTVKWHVSRLKMMEIIYDRKQGKFIRYYIKGNIADIVSLMKSYHPSIWSKLASSLVEMFLELSSTSNATDMQDTKGKTDGNEKDYEN